jgi:hypothetical protein
MRNHPGIGPYSARLRRGIGAGSMDGRSALGRYLRDMQNQLVKHAGGPDATLGSLPITTQLLIERIVKATWQINLLDDKLAAGEGWTEHDSRTHGGLINRHRLLLREFGIKPAAARRLTPIERHQALLAAQTGESR